VETAVLGSSIISCQPDDPIILYYPNRNDKYHTAYAILDIVSSTQTQPSNLSNLSTDSSKLELALDHVLEGLT
jgi:hypothetical protein